MMRLAASASLGGASSSSTAATVLCLAAQTDGSTISQPTSNLLAAATSDRNIHLLDRSTLKVMRMMEGAHGDRINELAFAPGSSLVSCSSDGCVKLWDVSTSSGSAPISTLFSGKPGGGDGGSSSGNDEIWSCAADAFALAIGTETAIVLWDVRKTSKPVARYEVHTEAVTAVRFKPNTGGRLLLSGSVDELMCEIDCTNPEEDEAVLGVHNTETPVASLGFYGADSSMAWAVSSTDVVSLWSLEKAERLSLLDTLVGHKAADYLEHEEDGGLSRAQAGGSAHAALPSLDFVSGCQWDATTGRLLMLGGCKRGAAHLFELSAPKAAAAAAGEGGATGEDAPPPALSSVRPLHALPGGHGGHSDVVRCFVAGRGADSLISGGDDGRLCAWSGTASGGSEAAASGGPLSKKDKKDKPSRAKPYDKPGSGGSGKR